MKKQSSKISCYCPFKETLLIPYQMDQGKFSRFFSLRAPRLQDMGGGRIDLNLKSVSSLTRIPDYTDRPKIKTGFEGSLKAPEIACHIHIYVRVQDARDGIFYSIF